MKYWAKELTARNQVLGEEPSKETLLVAVNNEDVLIAEKKR